MRTSDRSRPGSAVVATVAVLVVALVLIPLGVQATTNHVIVTDPDHPSSAAHVVGGALQVGDGSGPLTVDGQAGSFPVQAGAYFTKTVHLSAIATPSAVAVIHGPNKAGVRYAITSVTFTNDGTQSSYLDEAVGVLPASDKGVCTANSGLDGPVYAAVPFQETVHLTYPQPVVTTAGSTAVCLVAQMEVGASGGWDAHVNVTGYVLS